MIQFYQATNAKLEIKKKRLLQREEQNCGATQNTYHRGYRFIQEHFNKHRAIFFSGEKSAMEL